jgi:IS30 family transposase
LWQNLRGARKQRRKRYGRYDSRGRLAGKKPIEQRPAVVANRGRIGDWEMDTIHGRGKACVVTVVERKTGLLRMVTDSPRHEGADAGTDGQAALGGTPAGQNHHGGQWHRVS